MASCSEELYNRMAGNTEEPEGDATILFEEGEDATCYNQCSIDLYRRISGGGELPECTEPGMASIKFIQARGDSTVTVIGEYRNANLELEKVIANIEAISAQPGQGLLSLGDTISYKKLSELGIDYDLVTRLDTFDVTRNDKRLAIIADGRTYWIEANGLSTLHNDSSYTKKAQNYPFSYSDSIYTNNGRERELIQIPGEWYGEIDRDRYSCSPPVPCDEPIPSPTANVGYFKYKSIIIGIADGVESIVDKNALVGTISIPENSSTSGTCIRWYAPNGRLYNSTAWYPIVGRRDKINITSKGFIGPEDEITTLDNEKFDAYSMQNSYADGTRCWQNQLGNNSYGRGIVNFSSRVRLGNDSILSTAKNLLYDGEYVGAIMSNGEFWWSHKSDGTRKGSIQHNSVTFYNGRILIANGTSTLQQISLENGQIMSTRIIETLSEEVEILEEVEYEELNECEQSLYNRMSGTTPSHDGYSMLTPGIGIFDAIGTDDVTVPGGGDIGNLPNQIDLSSFGVLKIFGIHATTSRKLYIIGIYEDSGGATEHSIFKFSFNESNVGGILGITSLDWIKPTPIEVPRNNADELYDVFRMHGSSPDGPIAILKNYSANTTIGQEMHYVDSDGNYITSTNIHGENGYWGYAGMCSATEQIVEKVQYEHKICSNWATGFWSYRMKIFNVITGQYSIFEEMRGEMNCPGCSSGSWFEMASTWADKAKKISANIFGTIDDYTAIGETKTYTCGDGSKVYRNFGKYAIRSNIKIRGTEPTNYDNVLFGGKYYQGSANATYKSVNGFNDIEEFETIAAVPTTPAQTLHNYVHIYAYRPNSYTPATIIFQVPILGDTQTPIPPTDGEAILAPGSGMFTATGIEEGTIVPPLDGELAPDGYVYILTDEAKDPANDPSGWTTYKNANYAGWLEADYNDLKNIANNLGGNFRWLEAVTERTGTAALQYSMALKYNNNWYNGTTGSNKRTYFNYNGSGANHSSFNSSDPSGTSYLGSWPGGRRVLMRKLAPTSQVLQLSDFTVVGNPQPIDDGSGNIRFDNKNWSTETEYLSYQVSNVSRLRMVLNCRYAGGLGQLKVRLIRQDDTFIDIVDIVDAWLTNSSGVSLTVNGVLIQDQVASDINDYLADIDISATGYNPKEIRISGGGLSGYNITRQTFKNMTIN